MNLPRSNEGPAAPAHNLVVGNHCHSRPTMPLPARDFWTKIQKEIHGKPDREQLRIVRGYLDAWHDSWKGPYWDLKERLRRLAHKLENRETVKGRSGSHDAFHVARQGVAQVGFAGLENTGKSALIHALTGAPTTIADYPFTTTHPSPGILACPGGSLQLVDTPPVMRGLAEGEGPGRPLLHLLSTMDALALVLDSEMDLAPQLELVLAELESGDLATVPGALATVLEPRGKGGIKFGGRQISRDEALAARRLLDEAGVEHAEVVIRTAYSEGELRAQVERRKVLPTVVVAGKSDAEGAARRLDSLRATGTGFTIVAASFFDEASWGVLTEVLVEALGLVRVWLLERGEADADAEPHLVPSAASVEQVAAAARGSTESLRRARVWGTSAPQPGQAVGLHHLVEAGDRLYLET